ncbi:MAG: hypothetical protein ISS69_08905 [Phycisphaerae bacterium]|nr:hypothetical protein [Phycisphaerae bacterium]
MESKIECVSSEPLSPLVDLGEAKPPCGAVEVPDVVIVFELDHQQYAAARKHFDHLIGSHNLSAHVHFED